MKEFFACLAVMLSSGCIEFEKQTLLFRHYPETDTLVIWQHYEGIYGGKRERGLTGKEREQLHSVITGQHTFFFDNWVFEYDAEKIKSYIKEIEAKLKQGHVPPELVKETRQLLALAQLAQKSVTIQNGPFYLSPKGRLSATQQITIRDVGRIIREANIATQASILRGDLFDRVEEGFPNAELFEKSAHAKMKYLTLKGQRLQLQLPMTAENYRKEIGDKNELKVLREVGVLIAHRDNLLTVTIGKVKAAETSVSMDIPDMAYQPNATEAVKERYGLAKDFDSAKARAKFLQDCDARFGKNGEK